MQCVGCSFSASFLKYLSNCSTAHNAVITAKVQGGREVRGVGRSFVVSINLFWLIHDECVYDCQFTQTKPITPQPSCQFKVSVFNQPKVQTLRKCFIQTLKGVLMKLLFFHSLQEKINLAPCTFSWTHFIYHYLQKCKIDKPIPNIKYHIQQDEVF